jgi:integrase
LAYPADRSWGNIANARWYWGSSGWYSPSGVLIFDGNPNIVEDTLGHASLSMTLGVYSHVQAAMKDEAAVAMDSTFS